MNLTVGGEKDRDWEGKSKKTFHTPTPCDDLWVMQPQREIRRLQEKWEVPWVMHHQREIRRSSLRFFFTPQEATTMAEEKMMKDW